MKFWEGRKVLITGHTGFKGAWLCLMLQQLGAKIIGYALKPPTSPSLFELSNAADGMISLEGDIRDYDKLKSVLNEYSPEIVIHMAAQPLVRLSYLDPINTYSTNVMGTVCLLEAVRSFESVKAIVNITSDKCYENREWYWGCREDDTLAGFDPYSSSKACAELITSAFRCSFFSSNIEKDPVSIATARSGNVIGGGDWAGDRLVPDCIRSWLNNETVLIRYPKAVRPWQHVLEPLRGYLLLAEKLVNQGVEFSEAWNFGPNDYDACTTEELVSSLAKKWGSTAEWLCDETDHPHESNYLKLDISKAKIKLGWYPVWDLNTALQKTTDWYDVYQENPKKIPYKSFAQIDEFISLAGER